MPRLSLRGAGSIKRRSHHSRAIGFYEDEEDELEVVPGQKGHSVDNATYVSVSEGVFKRVDIGTEDGSTGDKAKKVAGMENATTTNTADPASPTRGNGSYVTSLMKWLALDEEKQPESDKNVETVRMYHGMGPYVEPKPVKTIKPPTAKPERPSSPIPAMRHASRPRPTLILDQLGRASSPRRPVSPEPRHLSPLRRYEPQSPVSPQLRLPRSDGEATGEKSKSKTSVTDTQVTRRSLNRATRPPSVDLTSARKKKPRVKRSPIVPVQSNRVRSSHRPFDHPSKSPTAFNRHASVRIPVDVAEPMSMEISTRLIPEVLPMAVSTKGHEIDPSSAKEAAPVTAEQRILPVPLDTSHDASYSQQNAIEEIEAKERGDNSHILCFCQPESSESHKDREGSVVAETSEGSKTSGVDADSSARPKQSFLANLLNFPSLCLPDLDDREDHRDDQHGKEGEINMTRVPVSSLPKNTGGGDSTTASSISLAQTATSASTNTTNSSSVGNTSRSYDDGSLSDSDDSTAPGRGKKKTYKLTVTFEPPTWLS